MTRLYNDTPDLVEMLKSRPDHMVVTPQFIAVWHTGLGEAIMIPGRFANISDQAAEANLNEALIRLNAEILS